MKIFWRVFKKAKLTLLFLLTFAISIIHSGKAIAVDQSIIEAAKNEGQVYLYVGMNVEKLVPLVQKFKQKYPFINVQFYRGKSTEIMGRLSQEKRAKRHTADVINATYYVWNDLKKGEFLMKYKSSETVTYPKVMKDPDDYWTVLFLQVNGMVYNTKLISPKEAPQNYEDLLDPRWKGKKVGLDAMEYSWFTIMLEILGEEKGLNFMRRLAKQELYLRNNKTLLTLLLAAGEFPILTTAHLDGAMLIKKTGAPIDWVPASNPIPVTTSMVGVSANAPHPNSAKLFVDFLLSEEGQKMLSQMGNSVPRPGIETALSHKIKGFDLRPINPALPTGFSDKLFNEIFKPSLMR